MNSRKIVFGLLLVASLTLQADPIDPAELAKLVAAEVKNNATKSGIVGQAQEAASAIIGQAGTALHSAVNKLPKEFSVKPLTHTHTFKFQFPSKRTIFSSLGILTSLVGLKWVYDGGTAMLDSCKPEQKSETSKQQFKYGLIKSGAGLFTLLGSLAVIAYL